jgi:hypothetical protein
MAETNPEDMSLEEVKEQLALYNRLYYRLRRTEKDFMETKKASAVRHYRRKQMDKMIERGEVELNMKDPRQPEDKAPNNGVRPTKPKKYKVQALKVITTIPEEPEVEEAVVEGVK